MARLLITKLRKVKSHQSNSGQALLIVLLTVSVAIMVVLSVVSKSVTDVAITSSEEDSQRAFSAAEAGVEEVLTNLATGTFSGTVGSSKYDGSVSQEAAGPSFHYPEQILSGDTGTIWFISRNNSGVFSCLDLTCTNTNIIYFYWGTNPILATPKPAVEITIFYDSTAARRSFLNSANTNPADINYSGVRARTYAYDPDSSRIGQNNFTLADEGSYDVNNSQARINYNYRARINNLNSLCAGGANCLVMAKVRFLYNTTIPQGFGVSVPGAGRLPAQGFKISSVGKAGENDNTQRKVEVFQGYPEPPSIFDSTLFSLKGLEK